ncbi:UNVERIFIED_ORG: alpha-tubulin suppressor-like RCC1 family protein [Arthrobacter sp. UYCu721]
MGVSLRVKTRSVAVFAALIGLLATGGATALPANAAAVGGPPPGFSVIGGTGAPSEPGAMVPVAPYRALDTRNSAAVGADSSVSFQVGGVSGIPANVSAVVFNLTVADAKSFGFITAYASGSSRPNASNVNFSAGQIVPNSVTVPVGADGKVTLFNRSGGTVQLIADVSGYFIAGTPTVPGAFKGLSPARLLDTRTSSAVGADSSVSFQVGGVSGIPSNASSVVFNLTVADAKSFGFITAYASGTSRPNASNVNFSAGQIVPNSVTVPVGADGKVTLFNRSGGTVQLIADVSGYYLPGTATAAGTFQGLSPARLLDTRNNAAVGLDAPVSFQVGGVSGIPANVSAVVFNLTVADAKSFGFITAYASGTGRPNASNVNFSAGQIVPNSVTVPVGADGKVTLFNRSGGTVQLIADVSGYYLPGTPTGSVYTWGANTYGQLGNGTDTASSTPVRVAGLSGVTTITGERTRVALLADGTVRSWGNNDSGQLGNGTTVNSNVPVQVTGLTGVTAIAGADSVWFALLTDGTVRAWGYNAGGYLGNGTTTNSSVPVQVSGLTGVKAISHVGATVYALLTDGTVRAWGSNNYGQLGNGTTSSSSSVPVQVAGLSGVKQLASNSENGYALLTDGTVRAWGRNWSGQLGNGIFADSNSPVQVTGLTGVTEIAAIYGAAYAVLTDGSVRSWGSNDVGQLGNGTTAASSVPTQVTGLSGLKRLHVDTYGPTFALLTDGSVRVWGRNALGQLGNGSTADSSVPVQATGLTGVTELGTNFGNAYALLTDGTVRSWGANYVGQLGNGTTTDSSIPVVVTGLGGITGLQR